MTVKIETQREQIVKSIEESKEVYLEISHKIHEKPEIGNQEFFASETHTKILVEAGFDVTRNIAGHETGFVARKKSSKQGPTIAFLAEYDALPGLGHACGHNIIGTTSVAAGIALAEVISETGGEVVIFGTPAEEGGPNGSAKGSFVKHGLLEGVDAALMLHPSGKTGLSSPTLAVDPLDFHFYGRAAHAAGSPEHGINALDAVIQLFNGINALRQQLSSDVRIHGIITHGGDAPNIIPEYASARFFIRASTWKRTEEVSTKIRNIAEGAALATGSTVKIERFQNEVHDFIINQSLDEIVGEELSLLGEEVNGKSGGLGSTDAGNVSHVVPTSHAYIKIGPDDLIAHTNEFREAARSPLGDHALVTGAKALALTGYRLITEKNLLEKVQNEFQQTEK
ncbi:MULTISPECIES: M20 family metallopeptidase [unclassified Bacillus (in: firmicutes)]|uniref:M20 family metallopeptidase n=1 Tax=unclassified Bacillus (in: firmicutes) TaxID=185979 RepID=UPI0008EF2858|nr:MULTISPECIES: M20 family metallopeptidase [unclassified Bacillus (in: firmicutes)]PGZ93065.1 amidohydrolase [Bacillus sp. AFS029533]SFD37575.1 amidohydrolase [Bacillus sp. UNCCL81]